MMAAVFGPERKTETVPDRRVSIEAGSAVSEENEKHRKNRFVPLRKTRPGRKNSFPRNRLFASASTLGYHGKNIRPQVNRS